MVIGAHGSQGSELVDGGDGDDDNSNGAVSRNSNSKQRNSYPSETLTQIKGFGMCFIHGFVLFAVLALLSCLAWLACTLSYTMYRCIVCVVCACAWQHLIVSTLTYMSMCL